MPDDHELDLHGFLEVLADSPSSNPSPSSSPSKRASLLSRVSEHAGRRFTALSSLVSPGTTEESASVTVFILWVCRGLLVLSPFKPLAEVA